MNADLRRGEVVAPPAVGECAGSAAARDIKPLTGLRIAAAGWVVLFHYMPDMVAAWRPLEKVHPLFSDGHQAVPLFFMLSGFILSHVYFETYSVGGHAKFVWLRFARLWPVHVCSICALLAYVAMVTGFRGKYVAHASMPPAALPWDTLMVRCWAQEKLLWNFPAWSIHCEWFAYILLFPICYWAIRRIRSAPVLICLLVGLVLGHVAMGRLFPGKLGEIVFLFLAGSVLYRIRVVLPRAKGAWITTAGFGVFVGAGFVGWLPGTLASFALIILGLSYEEGWFARLFSARIVVYGGTISYSLYMTHEVVRKYAAEFGKVLNGFVGSGSHVLVLSLPFVALGVAALTHRLVEVPANRWLRGKYR